MYTYVYATTLAIPSQANNKRDGTSYQNKRRKLETAAYCRSPVGISLLIKRRRRLFMFYNTVYMYTVYDFGYTKRNNFINSECKPIVDKDKCKSLHLSSGTAKNLVDSPRFWFKFNLGQNQIMVTLLMILQYQ